MVYRIACQGDRLVRQDVTRGDRGVSGGIVPAIIKSKGMIFPNLKTEVPLNLQEVPIKLQVVTFLKTTTTHYGTM
jgi:hypothetical protein